jgi:hypothetical protein
VESAVAQGLDGFEDGLMFYCSGNDVPSLVLLTEGRQAENSNVVAFGRAAGEDHLITFHGKRRCDLIARALDGMLCSVPVLVSAAPGVPVLLRHEPQYGILDGWLQGARRVAIKVRRHHFARHRSYSWK